MSIFDRGLRGNVQSPFSSSLDAASTAYTNPRLPQAFAGNVQLALDYTLDALYPNYKGTVATFGDLPTPATQNDFYLVLDDGDGKSAGYVYSILNGVTNWVKRYDVDWSYEGILADMVNRTAYQYPQKFGMTDKDATGTPISGVYAGQRYYGGDQTNQNLTLTANAYDMTGNIQIDNPLIPTITNQTDLGSVSKAFRLGFFSVGLRAGSLVLSSGAIYDSSGTIDFGGTDLLTTANVAATTFKAGTLTLSDTSITNSSLSISFGNNALTTTGTLQAASGSQLADLTFTNGTFDTASTSFSFSGKDLTNFATLTASTKLTAPEVDAGFLVLSGHTVQTSSGDLVLQSGTGGTLQTIQVNSQVSFLFDAAITGKLTVNGAAASVFQGPVQTGTSLKFSTSGTNSLIQSLTGDIQLSPSGSVFVFSNLSPNSDNSRDLGSTSLRFKNVYLSTGIGDGTNLISTSTLMSLRSINTGVTTGMSLFWDGTKWVPSIADTEIDHSTLNGLTTGDAGHTQFPLLNGRAGGQSISGGTGANENLTLDSTSNSTKGFVLVSSPLAPAGDSVFSAGWVGVNLGSGSRNFNNMYSKGIHYGLRFDQYSSSANYPASSGQNVGRVIWDTAINQLLIDNGSTWTAVGATQKWMSDTTWNGAQTTQTITVSSVMSDARTALWQFMDNTNGYERIFAKITVTQTAVTITVSPALPAGSYRLIGIS